MEERPKRWRWDKHILIFHLWSAATYLEGWRDVLEGWESRQVAKHSEAAKHLERYFRRELHEEIDLNDVHGGAVADHLTREERENEEGKDGKDLHSSADPPHGLHLHLLLDHQVSKAADEEAKEELGNVVGDGDNDGGLLQAVAVDLLQVLLHQ